MVNEGSVLEQISLDTPDDRLPNDSPVSLIGTLNGFSSAPVNGLHQNGTELKAPAPISKSAEQKPTSREKAADLIEALNYVLLPFGAYIPESVLDYNVNVFRRFSSNGHVKVEDKTSKIPSREDLIGYPFITPPTDDYRKKQTLERGLQLVHMLTGERYALLTKDEIFLRGSSVAMVNIKKMTISLRYEELPDSSKVFFEQALVNTGFSVNGSYAIKTAVGIQNRKL